MRSWPAHPRQRVERAAEHVIAPVELLGALDGMHVFGFFDDADLGCVAAGVGTDPAQPLGRHVAAVVAEGDVVADPGECGDQPVDVGVPSPASR